MENAFLGQRDHSQQYTDLHVQNLGEKFSEEQLRELFVPFGTISSLVVVKDETGRSKEVGFVSYESHESAARAVEELNGKTFDEQKVYVSPILSVQDRVACAKRLLHGEQMPTGATACVEDETDEAKLRESSAKFGLITSAKAPGQATFADVHGYFEHPVATFEAFVKTLDPCICFDGSSKPMLCSNQCQAALKILGFTSEHKRMIDKEMERFELVGSQVLQDYFTDYQTAEIQLQASLTSYFCGLSRIASNADPCHRRFAARLAHRVTSDTSKPHYSNFAVNHVLRSSSDDNLWYTSPTEKLYILVELKCFDMESMYQSSFQKTFSQLMHAAALAFNAKQWDEQLCCCLGSLTHWHVFLLKVDQPAGPDLSSADVDVAPEQATFADVHGYFEQAVATFEAFVKALDPCICFDGSSKPMLCSDQCQAALKILGLTSEHKKMIDKEMERFKVVGSQLLQDYFAADDQTAKIRLQVSLASHLCGLGTIATSADPHHRRFAAHLAHRVTSDTSKPHYSDYSVNHVLQSSSDDNLWYTSPNQKLHILVELKCSGVESMYQSGFQKAFSQLMHAAALAYNAKQWDEQLCCCLGSLTHWHVFLLKVVRDPERDCPAFRISHYNEFALLKKPFDWDSYESQVVNMYRTLFEHLLLCLLVGKSTADHGPVS